MSKIDEVCEIYVVYTSIIKLCLQEFFAHDGLPMCRLVYLYVYSSQLDVAPGQSSAGQGYNVCTFGSCFTSCLWPTLPQVQDWLAALDLGPRKDATPSFPHSFPPKLPQSACPEERRPPRSSICSVLCSSSWTMTDRHLWIISIAGHYPIRMIWLPRDTE